MAKAKTFEITSGGFSFKENCSLCSEAPKYRAFYYPTVMNGDAEWVGDFCEKHKTINLKNHYDKTTNG